jgi:type I restriction enzyme R subunit
MQKIQEVVDASIQNMVTEPTEQYGNTIDLSGLNFEILEQYFLKTKNKHTAVQALKDRVEKQLKRMVERNPMTVDYYKKYQEIIEAYNRGKDEDIIKETFRKLIELVNSYSEEEAETQREGLNDEQKAIFDILRQGKTLSEKEKKEIKSISVTMLEELKKEKLKVEHWSEKTETSAAVFKYVNDTLFQILPYPTYAEPEIDVKTNLVYEHLKNQYYGGGLSVYGRY